MAQTPPAACHSHRVNTAFGDLGMGRQYWRQELKNINWPCQRSSHDPRLGLAQAVYVMRPIRHQ